MYACAAASSPFITSVGGTWSQLPEIAFQVSSGGFSNYFARPKYQDKAVQGFLSAAKLAKRLPPASKYNATGMPSGERERERERERGCAYA